MGSLTENLPSSDQPTNAERLALMEANEAAFEKSMADRETARLSSKGTAGAAAGMQVANLTVKAGEGIQALGSKFGVNIPFDKAGALVSNIALLGSPGGVANALKSVAGSLFGLGGLAPKGALDKLVSAANPSISASQINAALKISEPQQDDSHLVTLSSPDGNYVHFKVMPEVVENRTAAYEAVQPLQFPGAFQKFKGTDSVQWSINAMFISRTSLEAQENLDNINKLRAWTMPYFGENTARDHKDKIGAPPAVLKFKGFRGVIGERPVVITSLNWNWPRDVDYIPVGETDIPFPTVISVAIQVVESFSTTQFNNFDLEAYRKGDMVGAYNMTTEAPEPAVSEAQEAQSLPDASSAVTAGLASAASLKRPNLEDSSFRNRLKTGTAFTNEMHGIKGVKPFTWSSIFGGK